MSVFNSVLTVILRIKYTIYLRRYIPPLYKRLCPHSDYQYYSTILGAFFKLIAGSQVDSC